MFQNALQTAWYARGDGKVIPNFQLVRVIVEEKKNKMGGKESVHRERRVIFKEERWEGEISKGWEVKKRGEKWEKKEIKQA